MKKSLESTLNIVNPFFLLINFLDHQLNYKKGCELNEKILEEINTLKGRVKTYKHLTKIINKNNKTNFQLTQIRYQVQKFLKETYGKPDEDAYRFLEIVKKEANKNGYFSYKLTNSSDFDKMIYLSKTMLVYADYFLDVVLIDSTYKRNRFNLPLVNVIGINNCGQNIMLAFGILSEETLQAYTWFFGELKKAWKNNQPKNFVIDGCYAMNQGN